MNPEQKSPVIDVSLLDEEQMIRQAQSDPAAFKPIYEAYFKKIFLFVLHRIGDKDAAADITQLVFFKALSSIRKFRFQGLPFSSWLFRVAINECHDNFRRAKRARMVTLDKGNIENLFEEITADTTLDDLESKLPTILNALTADELSLIELRFFEQRSFREIGEIVNLTEGNAKVKTYRVLDKMKKLFLR